MQFCALLLLGQACPAVSQKSKDLDKCFWQLETLGFGLSSDCNPRETSCPARGFKPPERCAGALGKIVCLWPWVTPHFVF